MEEMIPFAKMIFEAVSDGNWWLAVAGFFMACVAAVRIYKDRFPPPWSGLPAITGATFALAFLGGLANALAAGAGFSVAILSTAFSIALAAVGGWAGIELAFKALWKKE